MRAHRTIWIFFSAVLVGLTLAACSSRPAAPKPSPAPTSSVVPESGTNFDLAARNHQIIVVKPGDLITVPLIGEENSGRQWSFRSPLNGGFLTLKKHVITASDSRLKPKQILSEWVFKVEKAGTFTLRLDYESMTGRRSDVRDTFSVKIVSDRALSDLPDIMIGEPISDAMAAGSVTVKGFSRAPVESINYTINNEAGDAVTSGKFVVSSDGKDFHAFDKTMRFQIPAVPFGMLELSGNPGAIAGPTIPLTFNPKMTGVWVYWGEPGAATTTCDRVVSAKRYLAKSGDLRQESVRLLLAGPSAAERRAGYTTQLPSGVRLQAFEIANGTATADFTSALTRNISDGCRVTGMRQQIEKTLLQFLEIKNVSISVNGNPLNIPKP